MYTRAMALFIRQENSRSELQNRIAAELRERMKTQTPIEYEKPESSIESGTHESMNLDSIIIIVVAVMILGIAYLLLSR